MVSQMYMYKVTSKPAAQELAQTGDKIRDIKYQISLKCSKLKVLKLNQAMNEDQA
jgi:hypothetical protein